MLIEVIDTPLGPAPEEFREAWVGCILSVGAVFFLPPCGCPYLVEEIGSVEMARQCGFIDVKPDQLPAFVVLLIPAIQKLASKSPDAVNWWEKRWQEQGRLVDERDVFLFRKDACRVVSP